MGVPKRRTSKSRIRTRRHAHHREVVALTPCPQCDAPRPAHHVCPKCGTYNKRQVLTQADDD